MSRMTLGTVCQHFWHIFYVCSWRICLNVHCYLKLSRKGFMKFFGIVHSIFSPFFYCSSLWPGILIDSILRYFVYLKYFKRKSYTFYSDLTFFWNLWWPLRLQSLACVKRRFLWPRKYLYLNILPDLSYSERENKLCVKHEYTNSRWQLKWRWKMSYFSPLDSLRVTGNFCRINLPKT